MKVIWTPDADGVPYGATIDFVDFPNLAQITRLNPVTLAAMANAPAPPTSVNLEGAVSADTTLKWAPAGRHAGVAAGISAGAAAGPVDGVAGHRVWWRATTEPQWTPSRFVTGESATLKNVVIDDAFFGMSAFSADGYESPVVFPGDVGAF